MNSERYKVINYNDIGMRIRAARKRKRLTQQAMAEQVDLAPSNISHIERGTTKLSIQSLVRIANALDCTVDELLCDNLDSVVQPFEQEIAEVLADCTPTETRILAEVLRATKNTIRKNIPL